MREKMTSTPYDFSLLSTEELFMLSDDDVLKYRTMQRQKYLRMHTAPITQGTGGDHRWTTRVPDKSKSDGRRVIRKATKEEVENEVIKFYMEKERSAKRAKVSTTITLSALFPLWIEYASKRPKIASETLRKYRNDFKRFIMNSEFGKMKVREIDYIDIEEFLISEIQRLNLKDKALGNLFGYLKSVFAYAMRQRIIQCNPCDLVDLKNVRPYCDNTAKPDAERVLSDAEVTELLHTLHQHQTKYPLYMADYAIEICVHTGLRVGEVAALRWDCIENGELHIRQSEHRVDHDDSASTYEIGATKNGKERRIAIGSSLQAVFDRIHILQEENGIHSEYIIADTDGRIIASDISKAMYRRGVEANITAKNIHALRRTLSSKLNVHYPPATVALTMGHTEEVNKNYYNYDVMELSAKKAVMEQIYAEYK
ncbi:MAG: tyrosine-type recombinase/integrase [Lachnospiraceae bacterium]|nr:tyrosine-type recombinase/integrase [Lachnospiraceae bacterium]